MDKSTYIQTMIDTLMYDSCFSEERDQILPLMLRADINLLPQWDFVWHSGFPEQRYEDVELRVPVPLIDKANENSEAIKRLIKYVYVETECHALRHILIRPRVIHLDKEFIEHDVHFSKIQNILVQGIRDAKYLVWAAVAWFTNEDIFKELLKKKDQGLDIRLIISDEKENDKLRSKLLENFDVVVVPKHGWNTIIECTTNSALWI